MSLAGRCAGGVILACLLAGGLVVYVNAQPTPDAVLVDGGHYYGPIVNGLLEGQGRLEWSNGATYEGSFENGLFAGQGRMRYASGEVYEGEFRDGLMSGRGHLIMPDGTTYTGEFTQGNFNGQGKYATKDGRVYEGNFENGVFTGTGTYRQPSGESYQGEFLDWRFHGSGAYTDAEGNTYQGSFVDGNLVGKGRYTGQNHERYEGEFEQWQFHGQGTLWLANGDTYQGGFRDGQYDGQGTLTYAQPKEDGQQQTAGIWNYGFLEDPAQEHRLRLNVETALYSQRGLLDKALASLLVNDPQQIDLYLLAVAGDGSQEVFRREVEFVKNQFDQAFGTQGRSLLLINSRSTVESTPLATVTSLDEALRTMAGRMGPEDILFLFLTSHGSEDHQLTLKQNGMDIRGLPAAELGALLKASGIGWKVVVVSACYSGGFIEPVKDDHTLVITAARHDRASFGCADENDFTYFGRAFFKEAIPQTTSFPEAFRKAATLVEEWETDKGEEGSLPQMHNPPAIMSHLQQWRTQFERERLHDRG
jgi:hypothetical protein